MLRLLKGFGLGAFVLLAVVGFAAAGTLSPKRAAAQQAGPVDLKPSWTRASMTVAAGSIVTATLDPTTAKACGVAAFGPYEGQSVSWNFKTTGRLLKLALHTNSDATPGRWTLQASCGQANGSPPLVARLTLHVRSAGNGHGLLAEHRDLRVTVVRLHPQALTGSLAAAGVKVVRVSVQAGGRGGASDPGNDYPAKWQFARQDSMFDDWREYNRECTSFVAWALASRNGFSMPFYANAIDWGAKARARGFTVNSTPTAGSVAWSNVGQWGHVAYVESVNGNSVHIEEYNEHYNGTYDARTVTASAFTGYIHFKDAYSAPAAPPPPPPPPTTTTTSAPPPPPTTTPTPPSGDTTPPSTPGGLSISNVSTTTLRLNWSASSDNVGVTGYSAYLNGSKVGQVSVLYGDFIGLACGTAYTLGVDAYDAAGNVSAQASLTGTTSGCPQTSWAEEEYAPNGVNTFTNYHNASGLGSKIGFTQTVQVSCKVYDPTIVSVNPDGYWYRIASSPWNNAYYSPANTFLNGDIPGGPYSHNTDFNVPNC